MSRNLRCDVGGRPGPASAVDGASVTRPLRNATVATTRTSVRNRPLARIVGLALTLYIPPLYIRSTHGQGDHPGLNSRNHCMGRCPQGIDTLIRLNRTIAETCDHGNNYR